MRGSRALAVVMNSYVLPFYRISVLDDHVKKVAINEWSIRE